MIAFVNRLQKDIDRNIRTIESGEPDIVKRSLAISEMLEEAIGSLKEFIVSYTFKDEAEEIHFFKKVKPDFIKLLIFYRKVYDIELDRPLGSIDCQRLYLEQELNYQQMHMRRKSGFYQYYRSGASYLDHQYFRRHVTVRHCAYSDDNYFRFERDQVFTTGFDFAVASIQAHYMLQSYLFKELATLERQRQQTEGISSFSVTWTGSKTELIELIYALVTAGKLDYGKITLSRFGAYMAKVFNIDLGNNIARNFYDIRLRNKPTAFLDNLKEALLKRIDELNAYPAKK